MKKTAVKVAVVFVIIAFIFAAAVFFSCGSRESDDAYENSGTVQTNPNDDGFGTEVNM